MFVCFLSAYRHGFAVGYRLLNSLIWHVRFVFWKIWRQLQGVSVIGFIEKIVLTDS